MIIGRISGTLQLSCGQLDLNARRTCSSDRVTHGLPFAVRRQGVNDMHPGVLVSKISVLGLLSRGSSAGTSLSGILLNQEVLYSS